MSIFTRTMSKAIADYRTLLRRRLKQADRMHKLQALNLRDKKMYQSDLALYHAGQAIVKDIRSTMLQPMNGYYSYSGLAQFCDYLEAYLSDYFIENDTVIHCAQKASRALLDAIQLAGLDRSQLDDRIATLFYNCNETIVEFGTKEQVELQMQLLARQQASHPDFYTKLIAHLESLQHSRAAVAA